MFLAFHYSVKELNNQRDMKNFATSSIATDMIKGQPVSEALKLTNKAVVEALDGLPAVKIHCSVLAEQAIKAALADYYKRQGIDPEPIVGKIEDHDHDACHI